MFTFRYTFAYKVNLTFRLHSTLDSPEACSESQSKRSKVEFSAKIVNNFPPIAIFTKSDTCACYKHINNCFHQIYLSDKFDNKKGHINGIRLT